MASAQPELLDRVRETLEEELAPLVDELFDDVIRALVRERLNGAGQVNGSLELELGLEPDPPPTKVCVRCGETKPADAFQWGRAQCK
jgi:hypothetical protein